jgi:hypothetical protein
MGRACPLCPVDSDINLFGNRERIVDLNTEIADRAFDLGVTEQELHGSQIPRASVDQRCLSPAKRVGAKHPRVKPDACHPVQQEGEHIGGSSSPDRVYGAQ